MTSQSRVSCSVGFFLFRRFRRKEAAVCRVEMCKIESLRELVKQRLSSAVEEILGLFESTLAEYEEEIERQRRLLQVVEAPGGKTHTTGRFSSVLCDPVVLIIYYIIITIITLIPLNWLNEEQEGPEPVFYVLA